MNKGVSVVICCYNSEKRIETTLEHLKKQVCPDTIKWEVVLIDNASTDNTVQISYEYWGNYGVPLRVIKEEKPGLSHAREAGFISAQYDYVSMVDDDNWVCSDWVKTVYNIMDSNPLVGACGGRGEGAFEIDPPFWFEEQQYAYAVGPQLSMISKDPSNSKFLYGAGITIRKSLWLNLKEKGFSPILSGRKGTSLTSGEDFELTLAIQLSGYDLFYDSNLTFMHYMTANRLSWDYLKKLHFSFGKASAIIDLYKVHLNNFQGIRKLRVSIPFISICYSVYLILKYLPKSAYLKILGKWKVGDDEMLSNEWRKGKLASYIEIYSIMPNLVNQIKSAEWLKK